jgi:pyruvate dehydrogenase (quinone)
VDDPDGIASAWDTAIAADRPVVLEVVADLEIPPLPPHIKLKQAKNYFQALRQEGPSGAAALRATLKQWWAS